MLYFRRISDTWQDQEDRRNAVNIFGIGTQEILIIAVASLIIFGPNRLPEVAGQAAKWIRDLRKMSTDLMGDIEGQAGVREFKDAIESEIKGVKTQVNKATAGVNKEIAGVNKTANAALASTNNAIKGSASKSTAKVTSTAVPKAKTATATASKASTASKKVVATKVEPHANVSLMTEVAPKRPKVLSSVDASAPAADEQMSAATLDALSRARERRMAAGYNRSLAS